MSGRRYLKERQGNPPRRTRSRAATPVRRTLRPSSRFCSAVVGVWTVRVPSARHCASRFSISLAWGWHGRLIAGEGAAAACRQEASHRTSGSQLAAAAAVAAAAPLRPTFRVTSRARATRLFCTRIYPLRVLYHAAPLPSAVHEAEDTEEQALAGRLLAGDGLWAVPAARREQAGARHNLQKSGGSPVRGHARL
jgi:hypothetical protein